MEKIEFHDRRVIVFTVHCMKIAKNDSDPEHITYSVILQSRNEYIEYYKGEDEQVARCEYKKLVQKVKTSGVPLLKIRKPHVVESDLNLTNIVKMHYNPFYMGDINPHKTYTTFHSEHDIVETSCTLKEIDEATEFFDPVIKKL